MAEYRAIREKYSLIEICHHPEIAAEVTLQPVRALGVDAAILFADILLPAIPLGVGLEFAIGEGPVLHNPVRTMEDVRALKPVETESDLGYVMEAIRILRGELNGIPLIGFCGAPWTVATYMVAGEATPDQAPARLFAYRDPDNFAQLIDRLVRGSIDYLVGQLKAGAECVQIFDTWAGVLGPEQFDRWCIAPTQQIVAGVREQIPGARIIGFPRGASAMALAYVEMTGVDAIGIDWTFEREIARDMLQLRVAVQGNVDPLALLAGGAALDREVDDVLRMLGDGPLIFNLGHGILPPTPIAHVERMLKRVRG